MNTRRDTGRDEEPLPQVAAAQKRLLEQWSGFPIGTRVVLSQGGREIQTQTTSYPAMFGPFAVVWLRGITGAQRLSKVRVALARVA
jgi:hypothetical protein